MLVSLLHEDVTMSMPPYSLWLRGGENIRTFLLGRGIGCRGSRLLLVEACGSPAFAQYHPTPDGGFAPWALIVLETRGDRIAHLVFFLDTEQVFPRFGLPLGLEAGVGSQ